MVPLGLISLEDELREDVQEILSSFTENGVKLKVISGDSPETVAALAKQVGFDEDIKLVSGLDLEEMDDAQLAEAAESGTIFGRITPQQKERLVDALRDKGHYVAMMGDGVNDVLSLKKASLGIAMQSGSQATRSVADIVLIKDSFGSLAPAVAEGQRIVNGMQDVLSGDWRPTILAGLMFIVYLLVMAIPIARPYFEIVSLPWQDWLIVIVASLIWLFTTRYMWRQRTIERFLGIDTVGQSESE
jgi:cation-transporting ATPase E